MKKTNVIPRFLFWTNIFLLPLFTNERDTGRETRMEQKMMDLVSDMLGLRCQWNIQEKHFC